MDAGVGASGAGQQQGSGEGRTPEVPKQKRGERPRQQIRKAKKVTRRRFSAEEKIRIVMEGIRGEEPVSVLCRREGIDASVYVFSDSQGRSLLAVPSIDVCAVGQEQFNRLQPSPQGRLVERGILVGRP